MRHFPLIACHRGARLLAPENTLPAFEAALRHGGDILEFDVRQSRDGVLYILHDASVDRTTDGSGEIADMTSVELDQLDAGAWFGLPWQGTRLPRLEEFLLRFRDRAQFYLEVKQADCADIARLLERLDCTAATYTCSFDPEMRAAMRRHAPAVRQMLHVWDMETPEQAIRDQGAAIIEFHREHLDPEAVRAAQAAGLAVQFYSADWLPELFSEVVGLGFDMVNIDHVPEFHSLARALCR